MNIEELYNEMKQLIKDWDGEYYLHAEEGRDGIKIGGEKEDYPQAVGIEILNDEHPEPEVIELRLRRLIEASDWHLSHDGFLEDGFSDSTREIHIGRKIQHPGMFNKEFDQNEKIT